MKIIKKNERRNQLQRNSQTIRHCLKRKFEQNASVCSMRHYANVIVNCRVLSYVCVGSVCVVHYPLPGFYLIYSIYAYSKMTLLIFFTASQQFLLFAIGFFFFHRCHCRRVWSCAKCVAQFVSFCFSLPLLRSSSILFSLLFANDNWIGGHFRSMNRNFCLFHKHFVSI